jgi:hypothetical protein
MKFTCPYCQVAQIVQDPQHHRGLNRISVSGNIEGSIALQTEAVCCANPDCAKVSLNTMLVQIHTAPNGSTRATAKLHSWNLLPQGSARPLPDYIPQALQEDYREACQIADLSPKAAATLIRRCLQGMIRDFCQITKPTLFAEISELKKRLDDDAAPKGVSAESIEAIDSIRSIGNIGAHMEKDINVIIPVDTDEARLLINLTEMLFEEWYIARNKREARLMALKEVAASKEELRKSLPSPEGA